MGITFRRLEAPVGHAIVSDDNFRTMNHRLIKWNEVHLSWSSGSIQGVGPLYVIRNCRLFVKEQL